MSAITIENDLVHYEVLGRGRPVIFIHGWLGSWRYWVPTMQQLSVKYRTYALDLWGFGDSGKDTSHYTFKDQVQLLHDFMEKLGITKAALIGHSLGAAVCLRFATQYPDRAPRVALINPPLYDLGGLDDLPIISMPVAKPVPAVAAPVQTPAPAIAGSNPLPAAPAPTPSASTNATPASPTPGTASAAAPSAGNATGAAAVPPAKPATPGVPAPTTPTTPGTPAAPSANAGSSASTSPAATPPAPGAPANTDTIPRNPFRVPGETPEEILARLQAKNVASSAGLGAPTPSTQSPQPAPAPKPATPSTPSLPTGIGTPILPKTAALPNILAPARTDMPNPLLKILTGKPGDLLTRYVEAHAPDLDKLRAEVEKTDEAAIAKSVQSFTGVNLAVELQRLPTPTLLLHGKDDPLFPAPSDELLIRIDKGKPAGHLLALVEPGLHHFPMLEITAKFNRLLLDFLDAQDLNNVQFKDQWRRTMR